jgi:hypothetical protein
MDEMPGKRVLKTKSFARWSKDLLKDQVLCSAARQIERGLFEVDLGAGVCKKRVAIDGKGKSGSTRTLVAKQRHDAIIFLVGRAKNEPGADFSEKVVDLAKITARGLHGADARKFAQLIADGYLLEICNEAKI